MKTNLKILSVIGAILFIIATASTGNITQYTLPIIALGSLMAYAWGKVHDRRALLWVTGFLSVWYLTVVYSPADIIFWVIAFIFLYKDHAQTKVS